MPKNTVESPKPSTASQFMQVVRSPLRLKLFFLKNLPMGFIAGLRVPHADADETEVTISMGYLTKNPFRSIYFACQAMAAELSTGILAINAIEKSSQKFSVIVVGIEAEFTKKAVGKITYKCTDGPEFKATIDKCLESNEPHTYTATSIGNDEMDEKVAEFKITWSFKPKD
jgi:hypothetical protein